ncbi:MAG: S41 family peptidase [Candidatus Neomarinimicrobiota bacterium]
MKSTLLSRTLILLLVLTFFVGLLPVGHFVYSKDQSVYQTMRTNMAVLNQIIRIVNELYFEPVDWDDLWGGIFQGLMDKLDPHSVYIPPKEQEELSELFHGKFQGIGIEFDILHGYITVIAPVAGSPSENVGLQPGDQIVAIDGADAFQITREEVFRKLRGPKGSRVDISVRRIGIEEPFEVTIIRDDIPIYSILAASMLDKKTGYILLARFSATTIDELRQSIDKLERQGMQRLILDLRNNGGGYLEQAAEVANMFITSADTLVYTAGKRRDFSQVFLSDPAKGRDDFPLIVLINRGSASASEIVAGAVQDLDRGLVVGETSFGKGLVQRELTLDNGAAVRVTIARYYTPSGRLIQRPYENGNVHDYYSDFWEADREAKIDSLQELRPKYLTRADRTVYGGGGITPDVHIPWVFDLAAENRAIITSPKRPFFNWGANYYNERKPELGDYWSFLNNWTISDADYADFLGYLKQEEIAFDSAAVENDKVYFKNLLKAEIAGAHWGRDEEFGVRRLLDNQVVEALNHFDQAGSFLTASKRN